jgi:hemerythrin-like domain-containing protein
MQQQTRRRALIGAASTAFAFACKTSSTQVAPAAASDTEPSAPVLPPEDLMREHGLLERLLLVYEDTAQRLDSGDTKVITALGDAADIMRRFVEEYHEKLEEDWVFPYMVRTNQHIDLVTTLRRQHEAGRSITRQVLSLSRRTSLQADGDRERLAHLMHRYARMMRPHVAREDTVLFPAFRTTITPLELNALGEQFENREHVLFGRAGFDGVVSTVAEIERTLGIYDLRRFTAD